MEDVTFYAPPARDNFRSTSEHRLAFWAWTLILVFLVAFFGFQVVVVVRRWDTYEGTTNDHMDQSAYTGVRIPYLDVCEDTAAEGGYDRSNPPFVVKNPGTQTPELSANCRWFLNGEPIADDGELKANRTYYEPCTSSECVRRGSPHPATPRVWREEPVGDGHRSRYRCYRFTPPKRTGNTGPDDRVVIKWKLYIDGTIPEERLSGYTGKRNLVGGLLYRMSLADDVTNSWAFHREGLHPAMHRTDCVRNVMVSGKMHMYKWEDSFGFANTMRNETDTFNLIAMDAESGCFGKDKSKLNDDGSRTGNFEIILRAIYTTMDVSETVYLCDSAERLMFTISSCVAMFTLLRIVGIPFTSAVKTEPDVLTLRLPFEALEKSNAPGNTPGEDAPLLGGS